MGNTIEIDYNRVSIYDLDSLINYTLEVIDTLTKYHGLNSVKSITDIKFTAGEDVQRDAKIKYNSGKDNIVIPIPESYTDRTKLAAILYIISKQCPAKTSILCWKSEKRPDIQTMHKRGLSKLQKSLDALL